MAQLFLEMSIIENVALVEGLKHNLMSISQLGDRGYHVGFDNNGMLNHIQN